MLEATLLLEFVQLNPVALLKVHSWAMLFQRLTEGLGSVRQRYGHRESDYGEGSDSHLNP